MVVMLVVDKLDLTLADQIARLGVLLQIGRALLGELAPRAEQQLHRLLAALANGRLGAGSLGHLVGLRNAGLDDGLHGVLDPG